MTRRAGRRSDDVDVVVIGSGVAGLTVALGLAGTRSVALVTSGSLGAGSTPLAQGGLALAVGADDDPSLHAADTTALGAGLSSAGAVDRLVEEGPLRIAELVAAGALLDRTADGRLALGREGGHSRRRVVHAGGDASGAEVSRVLAAAVRAGRVQVIDHAHVEEILLAAGPTEVVAGGVRIRRGASVSDIRARAVVLATGGIGGLYANSTNPDVVTGEGLGLALRAGATLTDLEFVQFHPTALRGTGSGHQLPLVTEAMRGEGAVLIDGEGRRLMTGVHPLADLAPRDVVARRLHDVIGAGRGTPAGEVYLDATSLGDERLREHFPTVHASCLRIGVDPATQPIPVTPAQHFLCGGVRTDRWGESSVPGLFAAGEVAATGVHGANRLASNSLVEGLVFGGRIAARLTLELPQRPRGGDVEGAPVPALCGDASSGIVTATTTAAGIARTEQGLAAGEDALLSMAAASSAASAESGAGNRWLAALALLRAARHRTESRGCHWRDDFPETAASWSRHVAIRLDAEGQPSVDESWQVRRSA
ncbi:MAG TPA: L-aspartate oxidase [Mycobacteriales bacterium]|nr:L-aspartate oxidase [Mycobacteriales bacterium]